MAEHGLFIHSFILIFLFFQFLATVIKAVGALIVHIYFPFSWKKEWNFWGKWQVSTFQVPKTLANAIPRWRPFWSSQQCVFQTLPSQKQLMNFLLIYSKLSFCYRVGGILYVFSTEAFGQKYIGTYFLWICLDIFLWFPLLTQVVHDLIFMKSILLLFIFLSMCTDFCLRNLCFMKIFFCFLLNVL